MAFSDMIGKPAPRVNIHHQHPTKYLDISPD